MSRHHHHHHHHYYINGILIIILVHLNPTYTSNSLPINSQGPFSSSSSSYTLFDNLAPHLSNLKLSQNIATESASVSQRIIQTKYGSIRGSIVKLSSNSRSTSHYSSSQVSSFIDLPDVETYLGVPYATPPTGGLRFMPPVTPTHWRGVRLVNRLRPVCPQQIPQRDYRAILSGNETEALRWMPRARYEYLRRLIPMLGNQSEDCLYLNIYVPFSASSSTAPNNVRSSESNKNQGSGSGGYPVLVLLHGESYDWHSGSIFDGSILSSYGQVIVITVNYRLGILGFLPAFTDGTIRGNYGLMDQVAALHWIQENIGEFGGQPSNVTLIGHGHGASMAHLLMLSPMAKGLFNRVILMSGSALSPWAIARDPEHYARSLGQKLNCTNLETMIDCLRTKKIGQLLAKYENSAPEHLTAFGPIIDSIVVPYDPFNLYQTELYHSSSPSNTATSFGSSSSHTSKDPGKRNQTIGSAVGSSGGSSFVSGFDPLSLARSYDLMVGTTDADSPCIFSDQESMYGLEPERRDRILRTLVRNLYDYHQQAIFLILYNEYSAWSSSFNSIINSDGDSHHNSKRSFDILNSATSILSDALVFAPLVQTMDSHSQSSFSQSSTYFYRFDTNKVSQESLYADHNRYSSPSSFQDQSATQQQHLPPSQRLICSVGHDLAFLFGDPIAHLQLGLNSQVGPFYYPVNLTRTHQIVSELFMQYIVNFARDGDPNISRNSHFVKSPPSNPTSRQLIKSSLTQRQYWPKYDSQHKNFMALGSAVPKPLDEQKNHRLSLWLNLIPRLLIDDQEFFRTNFGANLTDDKKNPLTRYHYYSRKNFPNPIPNSSDSRKGHYFSNSREFNGHRNGQAETPKHVAGSMAMASEPYPSQQQQEQEQQKHLYRQHHLLVDYDNPKSYDGIVRTFSNDTTMINGSSVNHSLVESIDVYGNYSNNPGNSSTTVWYHHNAGTWNVTHNPMNSTNLDNQQDRILQSRHEPTAFMNSAQNFNGSTSWLIIIGSACALLFFINVVFFITLFYQLRKNRKSANIHNAAIEKTTESMKTSEPSSLVNQSPIFVASNHHKYRDPMQTTATSMGNPNNNLVDPDLMIQLHSGNATLNRKHANDNSRHTINSFTGLYATSGGGREQHCLQQPPQSISFQLTPSDNTLQRNKTLSFPVNSNPNNTAKSPHTILLNDPNDLGSNNAENYVPFMTNDPSNEPNTSQHQPTTYYCLQMNPNNNGLNNFDLNPTNQNNNPNNDPSTMISNNHNNTGIQLQHQSNQSSTSATYREMSV